MVPRCRHRRRNVGIIPEGFLCGKSVRVLPVQWTWTGIADNGMVFAQVAGQIHRRLTMTDDRLHRLKLELRAIRLWQPLWNDDDDGDARKARQMRREEIIRELNALPGHKDKQVPGPGGSSPRETLRWLNRAAHLSEAWRASVPFH